MWTYSTNIMGPMTHWYESSNIPFKIVKKFSKFLNKDIEYKIWDKNYYGGRIDCYCDNTNDPDFDPYNRELGLPIMEAESFGKFDNWLVKIKTPRLYSFEELQQLYRLETGNILDIWTKDETN